MVSGCQEIKSYMRSYALGWEKRWRLRGICGDGLKLRIAETQRVRHGDLGVFEHADELQGIDDGFAEVVIVGDNKDVARFFGDALDAMRPGSELPRGVKIVVALVLGNFRVVAEPSIVTAAMQADVAEGRSGFVIRLERAPDDGLIDAAECGAMFAEKGEGFRIVPGGVADFDGQRVVGKTREKRGEIFRRIWRAVKSERELQQHSAELAGLVEYVEAGANGAFFVGADLRGGGIAKIGVVRKFLPQLGGEHEARIGGDAFQPLFGMLWVQRLVEGSVDFDGVEELRKIGSFVKALGPWRRVNIAGPIGVGPAGGADAKVCHGSWESRGESRGVST